MKKQMRHFSGDEGQHICCSADQDSVFVVVVEIAEEDIDGYDLHDSCTQ